MKILTVSDKTVDSIYSDAIKQQVGDVDLVLACGDLPPYYLEFIVTMLNVPLLYVFGNHDQGIVVCSSLNLPLFKEGDDGTTIQSGSNGEQHMFWPHGSPWILCTGARSVVAYSTSCPLRWINPLPAAAH